MEEKSSFLLVFGDSPVMKVIDFLLNNKEFDYSLTDIAKGADVGWTTLHQFWPELVNLGIVKKTRKIGRAELYIIDKTNPLAQKLMEVDRFVSDYMINKELERQGLAKKSAKEEELVAQ